MAPDGVQGASVKDVAVAEKEAPAKAKAPGAFRNDKKAGVDNYSPAPVKTKLAGADYGYKNTLQSFSTIAKNEDPDKVEEGGSGSTVSTIAHSVWDAISKAADVIRGEGDDAIKFGSYVSAEKREIFNNMVKKGHNYGKKTIKYGGRFLKTRATPLYPVGFSVGMGRSIIGDVVIPEVAKKISNQSTSN